MTNKQYQITEDEPMTVCEPAAVAYRTQASNSNSLDTQTIDFVPVEGIKYDPDGRPVGITLDEWMERLDRKLISHYGDDFRRMLNQERVGHGLFPL